MNILQVSGLGRNEEGTAVLQDVSFSLRASQRLAIAGATGSGKTTLLKLIAGLLQPQTGTVNFDGERVLGPDEKLIPGHPAIAYLSQHFELRNRYRVHELLEMGNKLTDDEAALVYRVCRIDQLLNRWTNQLSGGERQRIALAILLVGAPKLLLLDEPFSNLDALHKSVLKSVLQDIAAQLQMTCVLVSHDPADVLSWAETVLILQQGRVIQKGIPEFVYRHPVSEYAAALFGVYTAISPSLAQALSQFKTHPAAVPRFLRPEQVQLVAPGQGLPAVVRACLFMGSYYLLDVEIKQESVRVLHAKPVDNGTPVFIALV